MHFNRTLLRLFGEMSYWERLRFEMPHYAMEVYSKCEQLRVLRENVMLVIRDYNSIIVSLQPNERALFRERIRSLDKKIQPGFSKLTWVSEGVLEFFITDCRALAFKVHTLIKNYKSSNRRIGGNCQKMSEMLLIKLDGKRVYEKDEFANEQFKHCLSMKDKLLEIHHDIVSVMRENFEVIKLREHRITWKYSVVSLLRTPLGPHYLSLIHVQCSLFIKDTIGPTLPVLNTEVSSFRGTFV